MAGFPDEVLLLIAESASQSQLATLCQVSRKLQNICTPLLYNETRVQKINWKSCLNFFESVSAHPGSVQSLYLGRDIYLQHPRPETIFEDILGAIKKCLQTQKRLQTAYLSSNDFMWDLFSSPEGQAVLYLLADCENLEAISLVNSDGNPSSFENRVPHFRNLRKLELLGMGHSHHGRVREVAEILVSSPDIRELGLSIADLETQDDNELLPKLVHHFSSKVDRPLRLQSLRLGYGFLPVRSNANYLSDMSDLTLLKKLRLDNDYIGISTILPDAPIDAKQFASACNVTSLVAERLSPDILELVILLESAGQLVSLSLPRFCDTQPRARMDESNEFWNSERYDEEIDDLPQWDPAQLFSQPLKQAGDHWRKVLIGDVFRTSKLSQDVLSCIATYGRIEDLTLPLPKDMWPQFREDVIPQLRNLQRLFLVGGDNACGYGFQSLEIGYSDFVTKPLQEYNELVRKRDKEFARHMATFAREVFQTDRDSIAHGEKCALLKYLGLGEDVYTCMLLPIGASCELAPFSVEKAGETWDYSVVKLAGDEAAIFESIQELTEGVAKLRVGGDDDPVW